MHTADDPVAPRKAASRPTVIAGFAAYVGLYVALLAWFKGVDLYHTGFATSGVMVAIHNACRVLFIVYLFWIIHAAGVLTLRLIARGADHVSAPERVARSFFAGAGIWHVVLLPLGFLGLYTVPVAAALTLPAVALSYRDVLGTGRAVRATLAERRGRVRPLHVTVGALGALLAVAVLLTKGLYPDGSHDYFVHYFYFYQTVIARAGVWPNEVWYHFFYLKGAGLTYLAILLTDPLGPQLVTAAFVAAATLVIFLLIRRFAAGSPWSWVGVLLFLAIYVYTPGWGNFEKTHELNAALVIGVLWLAAEALARGEGRLPWAAAAALAIAATLILNTTIAVLVGPVLGVLMLWHGARRDWVRARTSFALACVAGVCTLGILAVNYAATGLINDQGILWLWRFADVDKLDRWGALPLVMWLHWGTVGLHDHSVPLTFKSVRFVNQALRIDLVYPLFGGGLLLAAVAGLQQWRARHVVSAPAPHHAMILWIALAVSALLALVLGRSQPDSFYRHASFAIPVVLVIGAAAFGVPLPATAARLDRLRRDWRVAAGVFLLCLLTIASATHASRRIDAVLANAWRFATGGLSMDGAYSRQEGWPWQTPTGGQAGGAIYAGARGAYGVVGPRTPIWSLHGQTYCMLPDCRMETFMSFIMVRRWDRVMLGTPEEARAILQSAGKNHFLVSHEIPIIDPLPLSPLFAPDAIGRHLGIRWTDGTSSLLTWLGPETRPLDEAWLAGYRAAVASSGTVQSFPYAAMRDIYQKLYVTPRPWRSFALPWRPG